MKKLILLLLVIVVSCFCNSIFAGPWTTDTSKFKFSLMNQDDENGMPTLWIGLQPNIRKEYEKRFGAFPNLVLWKDNPEPKEAKFGISYRISRESYEQHLPWARPIKIKDVIEFVYWKLENVETGDIIYYPFTSSNDDYVIDKEGFHTIGWSTSVNIDAWSLNLDDNTAYRISPEIWEGSPTNGKFIANSDDSIVIVKTNHEEPLDYYMEKYRKNELKDDPDFLVSHVMIYPFHDSVLSLLSANYSQEKNCDSLKWITAQWLYTLENQLDPFYSEIKLRYRTSKPDSFGYRIQGEPRSLSPQWRRKIMENLQDVCGDTLLPPPWQTK